MQDNSYVLSSNPTNVSVIVDSEANKKTSIEDDQMPGSIQ